MNTRTLSVLVTGALVASLFVLPIGDAAAKKKKKKPKPKPPACATFVPGEAGAEKPLVKVTDAATEAAPIEQKVTLAESIADIDQGLITPPGVDAFNVQVDSANPDAGLYVLFEFDARHDYDLNLLHTDGSYAARSRRWNTISEATDQPGSPSASGHGSNGTESTEMLDGIRTADCGGWTVQAENWLGFGGEFSIKVWLGEAKHDPLAPGEEAP